MKLLTTAFLTLLSILAFAQETPENKWKKEGKFGIQINQVALTNWNAGGRNSVSGVSSLNYRANYKSELITWDNSLNLAYGLQRIGQDPIQKMDDQISFLSQYNHKFKENWKYSALLDFKTQFTDGYRYPNDSVSISTFMAPAYLVLSAGFEYKANDKFRLMISPVTGKLTIVDDGDLSEAGSFGVDPGSTTRLEVGSYIKASCEIPVMENVKFKSKVDLFSNYLENPGNIDVNWESEIEMTVNSLITVKLNTHLIYDHDIKIAYDDNDPTKTGARTQFKELLGVGIVYKF